MTRAVCLRMTAPRRVLAGTTYLVTRRCAQRQFLLRPSQDTTAIFLYVLAVAARRYGILVHAACVLSNHFHLVLTDPHAHLPAFSQYLDSLVARAVNSSLGRWESFWAPSSYSAVALIAPEDVIAKTAYVLANPVAAGLVRTGREWPGVWTGPEQFGTTRTFRRPAAFFSATGLLPETVDLEMTIPPCSPSADAFRSTVTHAVARLERDAIQERIQSRRGFLGVARVLAQHWSRRPADPEPHRELSPRVAALDRWKRAEALSRAVQFLKSYRAAWAERCAGAVEVVFPAGTYLLRVMHGVPCAASP